MQTSADTPYGQYKYAAEQMGVAWRLCAASLGDSAQHGFYGNKDKGKLPRMIQAIRRWVFPPLPEMHNRRSMVHVDDVVQAAILAAEKPEAAGQIYIVTDGQAYSTRQIYDWIRLALGKSPLNTAIPMALLKVLAKSGDAMGRISGRRFPFDSDALDKLTGSA